MANFNLFLKNTISFPSLSFPSQIPLGFFLLILISSILTLATISCSPIQKSFLLYLVFQFILFNEPLSNITPVSNVVKSYLMWNGESLLQYKCKTNRYYFCNASVRHNSNYFSLENHWSYNTEKSTFQGNNLAQRFSLSMPVLIFVETQIEGNSASKSGDQGSLCIQ